LKSLIKIASILAGLLAGQLIHSMVVEEKGKRKLTEIAEPEEGQAVKKQKIPQIDEFFTALWAGNLETVKEILANLSPEEQKELVNYVDIKGRWPLQQVVSAMPAEHPARSKYFQLIQELVVKGADINYFNSGKAGFSNQPLLLQAASKEDWQLVKLLLSQGANPNITIIVDGQVTVLMDEISKQIEGKMRYIEKRLSELANAVCPGEEFVEMEECEVVVNITKMEDKGMAKILELEDIQRLLKKYSMQTQKRAE
jgi:hypothetical protein